VVGFSAATGQAGARLRGTLTFPFPLLGRSGARRSPALIVRRTFHTMRRFVFVTAMVGLLAAATTAGKTAAGELRCTSLSLGPGSLTGQGGRQGARCLLTAYLHHCQTARYRLSIFGIDTIATRDFAVLIRDGRCQVAVTISFRIVPQQPHTSGSGYCRKLELQRTDILARACHGKGLPAAVSLTSTS
jgi:hypothetical protein